MLALLATPALAQTTTWRDIPNSGNTWGGSTAWDNGVPDASTDAIIPVVSNGGYSFVTNPSGNRTARSLQLGRMLYVSQGATLTIAEDLTGLPVGGSPISQAWLYIDGAGSTVTVGGDLVLAQRGAITLRAGALLDTNGNAVLSGTMPGEYVGFEATVDNATWTNSGLMTLGTVGKAELVLSSNATVTTGSLNMAESLGSESILQIDSSTMAVAGDTIIGNEGEATVELSYGMLDTTYTYIGYEQTGVGTVTVHTGSTWSNSSELAVGWAGQGTLNVRDGGSVETSTLYVGATPGASGSVLVSGASLGSNTPSSLDVISAAYIGSDGTGSLLVSDGAYVTMGNDLFIGDDQAGNGLVRVEGGSTLSGVDTIEVGRAGIGRLEVDGTGSAVTFTYLTAGREAGSRGDIVLTNGAQLTTFNTAVIGNYGAGNLSLSGGSVFTAANLYAGDRAGGDAVTITASGDGSLIDVTGGSVELGNEKRGELHLDGGADLYSGQFFAAKGNAASAAFVLTGLGTSWINTTNAGIGAGNSADLSVLDHATAEIDGILVIGNAGNSGQSTLTISNATVTVGDDLDQMANSTYFYVIGDGPTAGGSLQVGGIATIVDGARLSVGFDGVVSAGDQFVVLTAAGGVNGTYTLINGGQVSAFLGIDAIYAPNTVTIVVTSSQDFIDVASTPNQIATAAGLQSLGSGNTLFDTVMNIATVNEARFAFDQLSGEVHASLKTALIEDSRFLRDAANDRIRAAFGDETVAATPVLAYGPGGPELSAPDVDLLAVWGQGFGSWGKWDSDGNAARFSRDTAGMLLGADASLADWRIGLMGGYSHTGFSLPGRASSGSVDNYHLGLYGGTQWGNLAFRSGLAYTWHDIDTSRRPAFTGFSENLSGSYDAGTAQAFGEFGYRFDIASRTMLEPFANLAHVRHRTGAFTETGGTAALSAASQTIETTFTTLGLRASHGVTLGTVDVTARGMLGWRHAYGDTTPTSTHTFAGGDAFTVAGVPIGRDAALVEAGLDFTLTPTATLGITYAGQFASGTTDQAVKANLSVKF